MEKPMNEFDVYCGDNNYRYILGTKGEKTLYCFGINPSTATSDKDDETIRIVRGVAKKEGYTSFIMLNIYPQRATNPANLDNKANLKEYEKNLSMIIENIKDGSSVWAAWGNSIAKRLYLQDCLNKIFIETKKKNIHWVKKGELTKKGNPGHPLGLKLRGMLNLPFTELKFKQ